MTHQILPIPDAVADVEVVQGRLRLAHAQVTRRPLDHDLGELLHVGVLVLGVELGVAVRPLVELLLLRWGVGCGSVVLGLVPVLLAVCLLLGSLGHLGLLSPLGPEPARVGHGLDGALLEGEVALLVLHEGGRDLALGVDDLDLRLVRKGS